MTGKQNAGLQKLKDRAARFAGAETIYYVMPPLLLLLVCGTLAQRTMGLYEAQKMFFSSLVIWFGPLPLPGGITLCAVIAASLLLRFLFYSPWSWKKAGIHISHLGILILLLGGLITALHAREGYIVIPEGGQAKTVSDYHHRELLVLKDDNVIATIPASALKKGASLGSGLPFSATVEQSCRSCKIIKREDAKEHGDEDLRGMARFMALTDGPPSTQNESAIYGATLKLSGADEDADGIYVLFDAMPEPATFEKDGATWGLIYQKQQRELPFTLKLDDFEKGVYPGTDMARDYRSDLVVQDEGTSWPVRIEMNKPLRYKGYTFFQSSFVETPDGGTATVLAVTRNGGWLFPYLGTAVLAFGLLFHVIIRARNGKTA